ncbi:MAG: hypothetical protein RL497_2304 [Pseudomonadota bacterium]
MCAHRPNAHGHSKIWLKFFSALTQFTHSIKLTIFHRAPPWRATPKSPTHRKRRTEVRPTVSAGYALKAWRNIWLKGWITGRCELLPISSAIHLLGSHKPSDKPYKRGTAWH